MEYSIRKATEQDIPQIVELNYLLDNHHHNIDSYWKDGSEAKTTFDKYIKDELNKPNVMWLVVESENKIVGFFSAEIKDANSNVSIPKIGYILNGFILKEFRGGGIAKMVVKQFISWFKENRIKIIELNVASENIEGVRAWKGLGFREFMKKMKMEI